MFLSLIMQWGTEATIHRITPTDYLSIYLFSLRKTDLCQKINDIM